MICRLVSVTGARLAPRPVPWGEDDGAPQRIEELAELIAEFAADTANMAMMLADRCDALGVSHGEEAA